MGYATALYLDAAIALAVVALIPFLRGREKAPRDESLPASEAALAWDRPDR